MDVVRLIERAPEPILKGFKYAYGLIPVRFRLGRVFWKTYNFLQESQWWSKQELEEYQIEELDKLLRHAYNNVPYYREVFRRNGLKPKNIQDFDDFKKLPCLQKDDFKKHFNDLIATNFVTKFMRMNVTSGTSGKALQFYQDFQEYQKEFAFVCHQWSRCGYNPGDPRVQLRGAVIKGKNPIEYQPTLFGMIWRLSPRMDNREIVAYYLEKIEQFGTKFLHGYPGTIAVFASLIKEYGFPVTFKLKGILFVSERVYPWQRHIVEEVFDCRTFGSYGTSEHVVSAAQCEKSAFYHCVPQYGITEFDPETNEIIGTSFLNYANPFIRYRTTDIAARPITSGCEDCGRQYFPVFQGLEGRLGDYIVTRSGGFVSPAVFVHPIQYLKTIKNTQLIQTSLDHIFLKVVCWDNCDRKLLKVEINQLQKDLKTILGADMEVEVELVDSIQWPRSEKFRWIISEVSRNAISGGLR